MSLKAFHLVFLIASTLLTLSLGAWCIRQYKQSGEIQNLVIGIVAFAAAGVLFAYGRWFLHKLRNVSYL